MSKVRYVGWLLFPLAAIFFMSGTYYNAPTTRLKFDLEDKNN